MAKSELPNVLWDLAKILGGVVKDTLDMGDYRITIMVEKKVDDKTGMVIETITVDKRMSAQDLEMISKRLKALVDKK